MGSFSKVKDNDIHTNPYWKNDASKMSCPVVWYTESRQCNLVAKKMSSSDEQIFHRTLWNYGDRMSYIDDMTNDQTKEGGKGGEREGEKRRRRQGKPLVVPL